VLPRFYAPDLQPDRATVVLSPEESAHLTRVLRLRVGARLLLFDGRGLQHLGSVANIGKTTVEVNVLEPFPAAAEPRVPVTLAQAVLKGDKMDAVIRDATMMGVVAVRPVITERTVVPRAAAEQPSVYTRWQRIAVASAKQCGRAVVPSIEPPWTFDALIDDAGLAAVRRFLLIEPFVAEESQPVDAQMPASALILIGPEGGWSPTEVSRALAAGFHPLSLGARTLRAESAPLAALSVLSWIWKLYAL
jgi:16S rRNA (uracil1498-N3)-methyltransferase